MATDLAPEERRGEAVSYWSVAVCGAGSRSVRCSASCCWTDRTTTSSGTWPVPRAHRRGRRAVHREETHVGGHEERGRLIAPEAIRPGIILAATLIGITGFSIFLPLYAPDVGVDDVGPLFLVYGVVVVLVRIFGAKLPDRLGPIRRGHDRHRRDRGRSRDLAAWQSTIGLVVGTVIVAVGSSFLYPSMLLLVLRGVPEHQRGSVVGTFSAFFDFAAGASGIVLGGLAAASSYAGAFAGSAVLAGVALVLLRTGFARHDSGELLTVTEVGTASVEPTSLPDARDRTARHQRLPAQDRRDPVVPLRAVASAPGRRRRPCSPRPTTAPRRGTRSRPSGSCAHASACCSRRRRWRRAIDALAREVGARR